MLHLLRSSSGLWALFLLLAFLTDKVVGMPCNHQIFISTHHSHNAWTVLLGYDGSVRIIATGIQMYAEEFHTLADTPTDGRGVLAHTRA